MQGEPSALFVYGTLKSGQFNSPLLAPYARSVEPARIRGELYDVGLFPALVEGDGTVHGELVRLAAGELAAALTVIDRLEDYRPDDPAGSMYLRRVVEVATAGGATERAHTYFYNRDHHGLAHVPTGDWTGPAVARTARDDAEQEAFLHHVRTFRRRVEAAGGVAPAGKPEE